jgi:transposase InsO family protein
MNASGWSRPTVFRHQAAGKLQTKKQDRSTLYASASLPAEALAKLEPLIEPRPKTLRLSEPASAPAPLFAAAEAHQGPGRRIVLSPEQERQAMQRLKILQPLLDFCSNRDGARARASILPLRDGRHVTNADRMADYLAELHSTTELSVTRPTLWRWKRAYEDRGLDGLVRKVRDDKGRSKWAARFPQAAELVAATFMRPYSTRQRAYDALVKARVQLGISDADLPGYDSVCDFLAALPAAPVVWARQGERAHHELMASYLQREYTDIAPNQVWVADTMIHDTLVRNDCFGACGNEAVRLQLTALMDLRSRKIVGYTWCLDGSSRSITTALIAAVKRYGPCVTFYCDNGKDFKKVGRFARPANNAGLVDEDVQAIERTGALRQLGIAVQFCIKYHPQSKPIERFFRTLHLQLDATFPHYTTGNAYTKPDATIAAAAKHGKLLQMSLKAGAPQDIEASPLMPASVFIKMASLWIEGEYNAQHSHRGRGMDGRTPDEVFAPALQTRRPFDLGILDTLLWRRERRLVRNCAVTVDDSRYIGVNPAAVERLYLSNRSEVIVCFDPNDPDTGVITDLDGRKLCDVQTEILVAHSAEAGPMIEASLRGNRGRRNNMAANVRGLRKRVALNGHKTESQALYEQALPIAVGQNSPQTMTQPAPSSRRLAQTSSAPMYAHEVAASIFRSKKENE